MKVFLLAGESCDDDSDVFNELHSNYNTESDQSDNVQYFLGKITQNGITSNH